MFVFTLLSTISGIAQDIHFSQYNAAPWNINPGTTGQFDGRYRIMGIQRTQWRSVTIPYSTVGFAADMSALQYKKQTEDQTEIVRVDDLGLGIMFFSDKTGDSHFQTTAFNLSASYRLHVGLNDVIVPGIQTGLTFRNIDYNDLYYDNQWNGYFQDPNIEPGENFAVEQYTNFNFQMGMLWSHQVGNKKWDTGIGFYNLNMPGQSFFDNREIKLDTRINVHSTLLIEIDETWSVEPSLLWMKQGKYKELNLGGLVYYDLPSAPYQKHSLFGGFFFRTRDAGYVVAGLQYDAWRGGISYDFNLSDLRPASNGKGGFEFSLIYIIDWPPSVSGYKRYCPDYM